jgi:hypothetical protein
MERRAALYSSTPCGVTCFSGSTFATRRSIAAFWRAPPALPASPRSALADATRSLRCVIQLAPSARSLGRGPGLPECPAYVEPHPQGRRIPLHHPDASRQRPAMSGVTKYRNIFGGLWRLNIAVNLLCRQQSPYPHSRQQLLNPFDVAPSEGGRLLCLEGREVFHKVDDEHTES